jgi:urease accessory protein
MLCVQEVERRTVPRAPTSNCVRAWLRLNFERDRVTGQTFLAAIEQQPPLKVVRAFTQADGAALAHLHNVSGGLLGGDGLELSVRVGPGASVQLTTTGATRLYRPRAEAAATTQVNDVSVEENALLEYVPDSLIPFAGSRFGQRTTVRLGVGAGLLWWEFVAPGREARGELFEYERLELKMDLMAQGRPVAAERIRLEPRSRALSSLTRLGSHRYFATFYICRVGLGSAFWLAAERELREVAGKLTKPGENLWGVSTLVAHGLVVRCLTSHGHEVLPGLRAVWRAAKLLIYGREPILPRKVN